MALAAADLNVIAVDGVIAHLQRVQTGTFTLANFQAVKVVGRAIGQRAPLVQLGVIAGGNNPAVADQHRRRINDRPFQQLAQFAKFTHFFTQHLHRRAVDASQLSAQLWQLLKSMAHTGKVARARGTQRQTGENTFQIADLAQHRLQLGGGILQGADGLLTLGKDFCVAHRHMQPAFEHAAAHWGYRAVQHGCQRIFYAPGQVLGNFQIPAGGGVHNNAVLLAVHGDGSNVR